MAYIINSRSDPNYPEFVPFVNHILGFAGPNPDNTHYHANISGEAVYRLFGQRGTVYFADLQSGFDKVGFADKPGISFPSKRLDDFSIEADGSFEIILSKERPAGHKGNWMQLDPRVNYFFIRCVAYRPDEINPRFAIERLDVHGDLKPFSAEELDKRIRQMIRWFRQTSSVWLKPLKKLKDNNVINQFEVANFGTVGPVHKQVYHFGLFDIQEGEALIIEILVPKCFYWNIEIDDLLFRPIDFVNRQSSLNGHVDRADSDGITRIVMGPQDPGVENWVDTVGVKKGSMLMRWLEADTPPEPKVTKVAFSELDKYLPADTKRVSPVQRREALRKRSAGYQLRHHGW